MIGQFFHVTDWDTGWEMEHMPASSTPAAGHAAPAEPSQLYIIFINKENQSFDKANQQVKGLQSAGRKITDF